MNGDFSLLFYFDIRLCLRRSYFRVFVVAAVNGLTAAAQEREKYVCKQNKTGNNKAEP